MMNKPYVFCTCLLVTAFIFNLRSPGWCQENVEDEATPLGPIWQSYDDVPVSGRHNRNLRPLDKMMIKFIAENQIPGATLTVSRNGELVYARGFGYGDIQNQTPMPFDAQMRIASVSKPITAVAIMQLVDQGKLKLSDKVFPNLPHKPVEGEGPLDPRMNDITVLHLLRHTAGFDRKKSFDPMFYDREVAKHVKCKIPVTPDDIITYMLSRRLDFDPGSAFGYSNFGYSVLGRLIEEVSGQDYETYVKENVLKPLGIETTQVGSSRFEERTANEPIYYTRHGKPTPSLIDQYKKKVQHPYGRWELRTLDSHGGWIASGIDLVNFASAFDDIDRSPLLSRDAIIAMFNPPDLGEIDPSQTGTRRFYACGWNIVLYPDGKRFNSFHSGLLSGSSSMLVRRHDGLNWAVLFNTSKTIDDVYPASKIDPLIHKAVNAVKRWPK